MTKKSLTRHWSEKEEYADKYVALVRVHKDQNPKEPFEMEPVAVADTREAVIKEVEKKGLQDKVIYFYNHRPGTILG